MTATDETAEFLRAFAAFLRDTNPVDLSRDELDKLADLCRDVVVWARAAEAVVTLANVSEPQTDRSQ